MEGFEYERDIRQVVIDEAQDYSYLQYLIISKIFRNSNFTILGDVNQTINPYYKYESLDILSELFKQSKCISLTKTYRSSPEIIEFTNKILGLDHVCAIRKTESVPLIHRTDSSMLYDDISLPPGKLRLRKKGSAGGHNGMKSIIKLLGTENFKRIRVGVGKDPNIDIINYVLGKPKKEDLPKIEEALTKAMKASIDFVSLPFDKVMSMYNTKG